MCQHTELVARSETLRDGGGTRTLGLGKLIGTATFAVLPFPRSSN